MPYTPNITSATVLKTSSGTVKAVVVLVAGAAGTLNDCTATGAAAASNAVAATPAVVGNTVFSWPNSVGIPCASGIVAAPGAGQTIGVFWE